jgi:TP901-1 family phage major tail protein
MAASAGKNFLVEMKNTVAVPVFVVIGGLRTKQLAFNASLIDITNSDSVGLWREILAGVGVASASFKGDGIGSDKAGMTVLQSALFDKSLRDTRITVPGLGVFTGAFRVSAFETTGSYDDAVKFSASFESSGAVTFVAEA